MKLFKKLAAAALAAVLALSMVGCGAGGTGSGDITGAVKDYLADQIKISYGGRITAEHKDDLDTLAGNLIQKANVASKAQENQGKTASELVAASAPAVFEAAGITNARNYQFVLVKSAFTSNFFNDSKVKLIGDSLMSELNGYYPEGYGLANGKIGDTEYLLMLMKAHVPTEQP